MKNLSLPHFLYTKMLVSMSIITLDQKMFFSFFSTFFIFLHVYAMFNSLKCVSFQSANFCQFLRIFHVVFRRYFSFSFFKMLLHNNPVHERVKPKCALVYKPNGLYPVISQSYNYNLGH